jgi:quinohemoprotein ethanol dehydrogenase
MTIGRRAAATAMASLALLGIQAAPLLSQGGRPAAAVDGGRMRAADAGADAGNWMSYGRTWDEQRYSPLKKIDDRTVGGLGLAWFDELNTNRGVQATPVVVDGVLYNASVFNIVTAYDAATGRKLWTYDPKVAREWARLACCGPTSRGIAVWEGKVYIGALDGRLIAVDARDGREIWSRKTFENDAAYSITGAPRVFDGKVVIGNGGADYGVRGFVVAYDAETGKRLWKFYTVPGDPKKGPDGEASDSMMPMAAKTWNGEWWKYGGGGTAWDSIVYDPKLNLVYIGTGNGSPHQQAFRSPGGGDNLFLCSILAVNADTGKYVWHYQMVPNEQWDYTCTQPMMLADLKIAGRTRKILMQAPKNGFFYVLDRTDGKVISAKSYVPNGWASGVDLKTGRPNVYPSAYNTTTPKLLTPSFLAAHTWHPMAYSPKTGLVYLSAQEQASIYARLPDGQFKYVPFRSNSGNDFTSNPELRKKLQAEANATEKGYLLAWNPVTQTEAFRVPYPHPGSGGVLATAGNLLFQGTINKTFTAYRADNGKKLWETKVDSVAIAGPVTYEMKGEQYVAVNVGWGGSPVYGLMNAREPFRFAPARLLVFKIGGTAKLPPMPAPTTLTPPPRLTASEADIRRGAKLYGETCSRCHGEEARGGVKDLRFMSPETHKEYLDIVLGGKRVDKGMASFKDLLSKDDAEAIHGYLIARANEDWQDEAAR